MIGWREGRAGVYAMWSPPMMRSSNLRGTRERLHCRDRDRNRRAASRRAFSSRRRRRRCLHRLKTQRFGQTAGRIKEMGRRRQRPIDSE